MNYNKLFNNLADNPSRNYKQHILEVNINDELLKKIIKLTLDPFINFYIKKIPSYTTNELKDKLDLESAIDSLSNLSNRLVTGNAAFFYLQEILSSLSPDDALVIERIIKKDLKCGVSNKTVNSVWSNLVPEYPCMLCEKPEKYLRKITYPAIVQKKEDGGRINVIVRDNHCEFRTRNGKLINLLGYFESYFIKIVNGSQLVFDGELLVKNENNVTDNRQTGNGLLNKAIKNTINKAEVESLYIVLWDCVPYSNFIHGKCKTPYIERFELLKNFPGNEKVEIVETHIVNSFSEVDEIFQKYTSEGNEGIILKSMYGIWENKRVQHQLKFKVENVCELRVLSINEGEGKYEGMVGALQCESEDGLIKVSVGSGLKDNERIGIDFLNKIISCKYNSKIKDKKTGQISLFLPIYQGIREDKDFADYEKDIL